MSILPISQPDPATRVRALDIARGAGIVLVVYAHVVRGLLGAGLSADPATQALVDSVIYSFHMPFFFFLSGSLFPGSLSRLGAGGLVRSRLGLIMYPYVLWSLIQGGIEVFLGRYTNGTTTLNDVFGLIWQPRAHFWFLYELFAVITVSAVLYRPAIKRSSWLILLLALTLYFSGFSPVDLFVINAFGQWFVFFALGVTFSNEALRAWSRPLLVFLLAAVIFALLEWIFHLQWGLRSESAAPLARFPLALAGIALILALAQVLAQRGAFWLEYIGRNAMEIYLVHILAGSGIRILLQRGLGISNWEVHLVAGLVGGVALPLAIAVFVRQGRWLGWIFAPPRLQRKTVNLVVGGT